MKNKYIFVACDTSNIKQIKKIITLTKNIPKITKGKPRKEGI